MELGGTGAVDNPSNGRKWTKPNPYIRSNNVFTQQSYIRPNRYNFPNIRKIKWSNYNKFKEAMLQVSYLQCPPRRD